MKKFALIAAVLLGLMSFGQAFALEWEDPSLCVNGQWLLIVAANAPAIHVTVPHGTHYGNQAAGGCKTPAPAMVLPNSSVSAQGDDEKMVVTVNGQQASSTVYTSYGNQSDSKVNHGGVMKFKFNLAQDDHDD